MALLRIDLYVKDYSLKVADFLTELSQSKESSIAELKSQFSQNKKHGEGTFYWFSLSDSNKEKLEQYHGAWWGGLPDGHG